MNRRQQIQLSPDEQAAFLREHRKGALATIGKDGFPHVVAMNFLAKDGAFYMTSYGKAQKVLNIRRNPAEVKGLWSLCRPGGRVIDGLVPRRGCGVGSAAWVRGECADVSAIDGTIGWHRYI